MLFINTRPQDRAENLSHALRMAQIEVLDLPCWNWLLNLGRTAYQSSINDYLRLR